MAIFAVSLYSEFSIYPPTSRKYPDFCSFIHQFRSEAYTKLFVVPNKLLITEQVPEVCFLS